MYLLDTNHCSCILQGDPSVISNFMQVGDATVSTCVIVVGELRFMVQKSTKKTENLYVIDNFLNSIRVYPIDSYVAEIYGDFKYRLYERFGPKEKAKRRQVQIHQLGFSENDLWIAAIAKRNNLTVVSTDSDFLRMNEVLDISITSWHNPPRKEA